MNTKVLKRWLPRIAVVGLATVIISLIIITPLRRQILEARSDLTPVLVQIQDLHPYSLTDEAFLAELKRIKQATPNIAGIWLFARDGEILQSYNPSIRDGTVSQWGTEETQRVLETVPEDSLTPDQRTELLAAAVMQREGEHNDIYQHQLGPIYTLNFELLGWVGLTYSADMAANISMPLWIASLLAGLAGLIVYWLSLPVWTWLDARQRGERAWAWATFVLIGNLVALIAYILTRAPDPQTS